MILLSIVFDLIEQTDWDFLTIFDSLRYDIGREILDGCLEKAISPVTCTDHWLWVFMERMDPSDIVFVTGNPRLKKNEITGRYREDVWKWGWEEVEGVPTCPPWKVNKAFRKAYERFGNDCRYVIWYVQPHFPYIGDIKMGVDICEMPEEEELASSEEVTSPLRVWADECSSESVRKAYKSNAKLVWDYFKRLEKGGRWIVTSDHGELLGEHDIWGHYCDKEYRELKEVPWMEID